MMKSQEDFFMFKHLFSARRWLAFFGVVTVLILAFLAVLSPQQLPVIAYKAGLVSFAACVGVWLDRAIFPYARPSGYLKTDWLKNPDADGDDGVPDFEICDRYIRPFAVATIRRGIIVGSVVLGMCLGL